MPKENKNSYRYISIVGLLIAIWAATGIGCASKAMYKPDCSTMAVNRALVAGIENTRIYMGTLATSPGHYEAQKFIDGKWYWLYGTVDGGVDARERCPKGFNPTFPFDTKRYIELEFFTDFEE